MRVCGLIVRCGRQCHLSPNNWKICMRQRPTVWSAVVPRWLPPWWCWSAAQCWQCCPDSDLRVSKCRRSRSGRPSWGCRMLMPTTPSYLGSPYTSHTKYSCTQGGAQGQAAGHEGQSTHGVGLASTRAHSATAGAGTGLRASSEEWSSTPLSTTMQSSQLLP